MNTTLQSGLVKVSVSSLITGAVGVSDNVAKAYEMALSNGTGSLQAKGALAYYARALSATNEDINFTTATDFQGTAFGTAKILALIVKHVSGPSGGTLKVKQAASNGVANMFIAAGDGAVIPVGGTFCMTFPDGLPVVASTGDLINVAASGASTYDFIALVS